MSEFTEALNYLIKVLQRKMGDEAFSHLQPGLTYDEIEELVKDLPIRFPPEFYELYQWRNGSNKELIEGSLGYFPLEIAVEKYLAEQEHYDPSWMPENYFGSPNWFQLYPNDDRVLEAGYLVVDKLYNSTSIIYISIKGSFEIKREYASLASMMLTVAECSERGASPYGIPFIDESYQIWRKYNISIIDEVLAKLENDLSLETIGKPEVANCLAKYKDSRIVELLIRILELPVPESPTSEEYLELLILEEDPLLEEYLECMGKRSLAARFLGCQGDIKAVEPLISVLQDKYKSTRLWAIRSLGNLKDERAIQPLIELLQDRDKEVRLEAARSLANLRAVDTLIPALKHEDACVRFGAALALKEIKKSKAVEPILQLLNDKDSSIRSLAGRALNNKQAIQPLIELLQDSDNAVRREAAHSLRNLKAIDALIPALRDEDACVRFGAALALKKIKDSEAIEPLLQVIDDEDSGVRNMARRALNIEPDGHTIAEFPYDW